MRNTDNDVRLVTSSCLSEILRIRAPKPPYQDSKMKEILWLFLDSFKDLDDITSPHFSRKVTILETFAQVRFGNIMLDLGLDDLIRKMYHHFFATVIKHHVDNFITAMQSIMTLFIN